MTFHRHDRFLKNGFGLFGASLLFVLPVLLADTPYNDDNFRMIYGFGWKRCGRVFSTVVMNLLDLRLRNIADIAPLGQILGLLALSFAGVFLTRRLTRSDAPDPLALFLCGAPLAIQPFFLENLSYQYDALPMLLAQTCATLAAALPFNGSVWKRAALGGFLVFATLSFYQPCLNTFMALCLLLFLADCHRNSPGSAWRELALRGVAFGAASITYHIVVKPTVYGVYEGPHSAIISMNAVTLTGLWARHRPALSLLGTLLTGGARYLLPACYMVGCVFAIRVAIICARQRCLPAVMASALSLTIPGLLVVLLAGLMLALQLPIYEPRTMTAFSVCVIFAGLPFALMDRKRHVRLAGLLPLVYFFTIAYAYGNALKAMGQFENEHIAHLAAILEENGFTAGDDLFLYGNEPLSPVVHNAETIFPILTRLLPRQGIHDDAFFASPMFKAKGIESREHSAEEWRAARPDPSLVPVRETATYRLYRQGHRFCLVLTYQ